MLVTLTEVNQQSEVIQPRESDKNRDPKFFWRMTVTDPSGNPHAIFCSGLATNRGRDYHAMIGQQFDCTFSGGTVDDRDGSSWKKAKLDKPGQGGASGSQGASAPRSQGGGGQGSHGGGGRRRYEMPRDDYFRRFWVLYFENATEGLTQLAKWTADPATGDVAPDARSFWEQVGKVTNQAVMSIGLECLPQSGEQAKAIEEAARAKEEQEAAERQAREEEEARKRIEKENASKAEQLNW